MEIIAICITKKPAFLHGEIRLLTTFNSSRHNHLSDFYCIASTWYNLKYFVKKVFATSLCQQDLYLLHKGIPFLIYLPNFSK